MRLSHIDSKKMPNMVDVSKKQETFREAKALSIVLIPKEMHAFIEGNDILSKKGSVFQTAIIAGVMAAKKTADLIPLCHNIGISDCTINIEFQNSFEIFIECFVKTKSMTGVEMEALTGASVAALTIYDMCKALSHNIIIKETKLLEKKGGKSDYCCK